jgi:carbonic anhydrase
VPNYRSYYAYAGSLSRPPCVAPAQWVLLKHSLPAADADLDAIRALQALPRP